jgi:hypothetical protein
LRQHPDESVRYWQLNSWFSHYYHTYLLRQEQTLSSKAFTFWNEQSLTGRMASLAVLHERGEEADRFLLHLCLSLRQLPSAKKTAAARPLRELLRGLETNVSRSLLCQQFAVNV